MNTDSTTYLKNLDAYWRATNYLSVGQLYLLENPLLKEKLTPSQVKIHPIGHWGTIPSQNFIYAHLNRAINKFDLNMFYIEGPGHGGQVMISNAYLDGSYTEAFPEITQDESGMQKMFKRFSFPGGVASHADPKVPGSIHEGGALGYSILHGAGAVLDNPDLIAAVVVGDGEAETAPLATSWHVNKFLNPKNDGTVLPILNLNGFKIANPTVLSRESDETLTEYFHSLGWHPYFVSSFEKPIMQVHEEMAQTMDTVFEEIKAIHENASQQSKDDVTRPLWPMIILRSPKGWTGPKTWDGEPIENSFRAHQIPIPADQNHPEYIPQLVEWLESYQPEELFDKKGRLAKNIQSVLPKKSLRMATNHVTNAGIIEPLSLPNINNYLINHEQPGKDLAQDAVVLGHYLRDIINHNPTNFRGFGPDETASNRFQDIFETTNRQWLLPIKEPNDLFMAPEGRIIDSMLSEHYDEGMLEAYTLTGRHGFFASYEVFIREVDDMIVQHFKWLNHSHDVSWRKNVPALNIIADSTVFQQDHNGYSHQDPGVTTMLYEKQPDFIREFFPADANSLVATFEKAAKSTQRINYIVASKHPRLQWFSPTEAKQLVHQGLRIIDWASTDNGSKPDIVIASAGSEPTTESLAAIHILHKYIPFLKIRYINVLDLFKLRADVNYGLSNTEFDSYFTTDVPVLFVFHGYEPMIESIFFKRNNHHLNVHGYREVGDITTPFDMRVLNKIDRFNLVKSAINMLSEEIQTNYAFVMQEMTDKLAEHNAFTKSQGTDLPEIENWRWTALK
ncbi:putative phosphoketolase 2 [Leuconostoc litchii]|uniref:Phosphoketolase family protein n=1 Tax=Leuconostoc litchii TaxID=1981069 RepID=A0A6P2CNH1_9LACO|nr:phosphoketolase family protein [Leuconostoc litchii]TYC46632.1 phosphoketolase family protein [Leuconostoc litchii]GMA70497.1 putative phosphoketolase 2 [Leuconostoc litchii]